MSEELLLAALPTRRAVSEEERRRTAVHEAGHAIVGVLLSSDVLMGVYIEDAVPDHGVHQVGDQNLTLNFSPAAKQPTKTCAVPRSRVIRSISDADMRTYVANATQPRRIMN